MTQGIEVALVWNPVMAHVRFFCQKYLTELQIDFTALGISEQMPMSVSAGLWVAVSQLWMVMIQLHEKSLESGSLGTKADGPGITKK